MKKIYQILFAVGLLTLPMSKLMAQHSTLPVNLQKKITLSTGAKATELFAQYPNSASGIGSFIDQDDDAYFAADDFQLAEAAEVNTFEFIGFQQSGNLEEIYTGVSFYIYEDDNGKPAGIPGKTGTPLLSLELSKNDPRLSVQKIEEVYYDFFIKNLNFQAEANKKYWVVFAPKINFSEKFLNEEMFTWLNGVTFNFSDAVNIDRDDYYQSGMTYWLSITEMTGGTFGDELRSMCFALYSDPVMSVNDTSAQSAVSIYPNPATDFIKIQGLKGNDIKTSVVRDMTGKNVASGTSQINIQNLPKGVYTVDVLMQNGSKTSKKIIKK